MYFCVNGSATTFANKFREYTAGAATSVPWSGVTGRPNVEDGAQKNVQSDWNAISGDAFILNKPTIPTKTSQLTNDSDFATQTVVTTALATKADKTEVEALLDKVDVAPQTYEIRWLIYLISHSNNTVTLTAEQFNEVKAAADAHKTFVASGQVYSSSSYIGEGSTDITLETLSDGYVTTLVVLSLNGRYGASLESNQIITQNDLSGFAKKTDISAFLKLQYQFANISESSTPSLTVAAGNWYDLYRGTTNPTSLSLNISDPATSDNGTDPIMLRFKTGNKAMSISTMVGTGTDGVLVRDGGTLECKANTYYTLTFWRNSVYWLAELREYLAAGTGASRFGKTVVKTLPDKIGYGTSYEAGTPSIELAANKFNIVGRCSGLTLTLPAGADMDGQEYCCQFYVPNQNYTLTVPADVRWQNGEVPTFEGNTCCQLVIVNNCATIGVFKEPS